MLIMSGSLILFTVTNYSPCIPLCFDRSFADNVGPIKSAASQKGGMSAQQLVQEILSQAGRCYPLVISVGVRDWITSIFYILIYPKWLCFFMI